MRTSNNKALAYLRSLDKSLLKDITRLWTSSKRGNLLCRKEYPEFYERFISLLNGKVPLACSTIRTMKTMKTTDCPVCGWTMTLPVRQACSNSCGRLHPEARERYRRTSLARTGYEHNMKDPCMISKASSSTPTMSPGVRLLFKTVQAILPSTTVTVVAASGMAATFHVAYPGSRPLSDVRKMARELKAGLREHLITAYPKISPGGANGIMIDVTALRLVSSVSVITDRLVHTD